MVEEFGHEVQPIPGMEELGDVLPHTIGMVTGGIFELCQPQCLNVEPDAFHLHGDGVELGPFEKAEGIGRVLRVRYPEDVSGQAELPLEQCAALRQPPMDFLLFAPNRVFKDIGFDP